jgi:hypothetical protein
MPDTTNLSEQQSPLPRSTPNLANVITPDDVSQKGSGSYKADYVNWCRVAHLLHEHANGWEFHVQPSPTGSHVWEAPNGTAYVVGFFTGPNGERTPDFPQAVMDNRNAPIAYAKVSARDFTDTHRRCLCTAAAASFGLAWQLWAREEIENPHRDPEPASNPSTAASLSDFPPQELPLSNEDKATCRALIGELPKAKQTAFLNNFRKAFNLADGAKVSPAIQSQKHMAWIQKNVPTA